MCVCMRVGLYQVEGLGLVRTILEVLINRGPLEYTSLKGGPDRKGNLSQGRFGDKYAT